MHKSQALTFFETIVVTDNECIGVFMSSVTNDILKNWVQEVYGMSVSEVHI